jgi:hypothetical protein
MTTETITPAPTPKKTSRKPTFGQTLASLALFVIELLIPALLATAIVGWLFTNYTIWNLGAVLAEILFVLAVTLLAFMLTILLDTLTAGRRAKQGVIGGGPRARLVKIALGGLIIPIAFAVSSNLVKLPSGGTALSAYINLIQTPIIVTPPDEVARTAIESNDPAVKRTAIEVLAKFQSPDALRQLLRLAKDDPAVLHDAATARVLAQAIAAYGVQARDPLLDLFKSVDAAQASGALADDLYGRYFASAFDGLQAEIQNNDPDRLKQVEAARAQVEAALQDMHAASSTGASGDLRPIFVLQTLQAMNLSSDADLLSFAFKVAEDARYPAAVRGDALTLVGQVGGDGDLSKLYPYLSNSDTLIQTRALQAISAILTKQTQNPRQQKK